GEDPIGAALHFVTLIRPVLRQPQQCPPRCAAPRCPHRWADRHTALRIDKAERRAARSRQPIDPPCRGAREDTMTKAIARISFGLLLSTAAVVPARAEPPKLPVPAVDQSAVAQRGYFYVGGKYVGEPGKEIMQGQIYVEVLAPKDVRRPYP